MFVRRTAFTLGAAILLMLPTPAALAAASDHDAAFLRAAHQGNLAEIAGGRIAQQKAVSSLVKGLAARFVADHTQMDAGLRDTAARLGVDLPAAPAPEQQALADRYQAASAAEFDALYVATQLDAHAQAMRLGQTELANGSDPRAEQVAEQAAPIIASHHEALRVASETLGGHGYQGHGGRG
ncbi:DUF4142 domain-containing protein [Actinoplanes sp. NPDC026623]|uniref:DUF4142 domain-containing protein n=1 Tax=Actinoplanes sp. NPDC026623 TaxID=3155610 RepID=UPI00340AD6DE